MSSPSFGSLALGPLRFFRRRGEGVLLYACAAVSAVFVAQGTQEPEPGRSSADSRANFYTSVSDGPRFNLNPFARSHRPRVVDDSPHPLAALSKPKVVNADPAHYEGPIGLQEAKLLSLQDWVANCFDKHRTYHEVTHEPWAMEDHLLHDALLQRAEGIKELRIFQATDGEHAICVCTTGTSVCGHKGVVHGGFTAAITDEALGHLAFANLKVAATKKLEIQYKRPVMAGTTVVVSCRVVKRDGRELLLEGRLMGEPPKEKEKDRHSSHGSPTASSSRAREDWGGDDHGDDRRRNTPGDGPTQEPRPVVLAVGRAVFVDVSGKWKALLDKHGNVADRYRRGSSGASEE
uniref:Thioesterase domain-containing protein n=1 Tax=Chromera velia CCMP2878 TaxID=1169474 RepID=A0A0G4I4B9_9ALVE|mmetsp:Transcript_12078/g.23298  ORF Transcript_12078/g.23298 Transcript_12078/m.23298 type:complete len:348 (+) Transcript_12078:181-1224(+)|eukprot:Cvel_10887.t1-p1 / transcript=Cvel_10887.t1 / gene=Cvel_10887 / organism=Chromera_velia_CCMP2878 / gene_product=hypothetical protein / transcript_product=hypothetical protein / location=Cvel_scaffold667:57716-60645(-) / protein_length=347 / sequence_SO=supercontig / SO=protein_coding / is_pseudo=false